MRKSLYPVPCFSATNALDHGSTDTVFSGYCGRTTRICADSTHIGRSEYASTSTLQHLVSHVVGISPTSQMSRIDTWWIITSVHDETMLIRYGSDEQFVDDTSYMYERVVLPSRSNESIPSVLLSRPLPALISELSRKPPDDTFLHGSSTFVLDRGIHVESKSVSGVVRWAICQCAVVSTRSVTRWVSACRRRVSDSWAMRMDWGVHISTSPLTTVMHFAQSLDVRRAIAAVPETHLHKEQLYTGRRDASMQG